MRASLQQYTLQAQAEKTPDGQRAVQLRQDSKVHTYVHGCGVWLCLYGCNIVFFNLLLQQVQVVAESQVLLTAAACRSHVLLCAVCRCFSPNHHIVRM